MIRTLKFIGLILLLQVKCVKAQTVTPEVINSAGDHRQAGNTGVWVTDNVGEPFTQTMDSNRVYITQGFIQPTVVAISGFSYSAIFQSPACMENHNDAFISVIVNSPVQNYSLKYYWSPSGVCPTNDCAKIDTLAPGSYSVAVVANYNNNLGAMVTDTVKNDSFTIHTPTAACSIIVYSGVTPNGDGINDVWIIDNITDYPHNRVTIYNRWGLQLADIKGYNNKDRTWPNKIELDFLNSSTYFYVIELEPGGKPIKGWVELIKNQ